MNPWWGLLLFPPLLWVLGRYTFWLPPRDSRWPRLVMLHRVTASQPASGMNMPPARFERLLALLAARGLRFVTVSELAGAGEHCVALTFDDGFADNYHEAFPLLKKYGAKATIYLAPDIEGIERMTPAQIAEMHASGLVEFGAHTLNHVNLTRLTAAEARAEITGSKRRVTELAGECRSFAYPFGRFAPEHEQMVREAGFDTAVSTRKAVEPFSTENRFHLPRISSHGAMDVIQMRIALARGRYRF